MSFSKNGLVMPALIYILFCSRCNENPVIPDNMAIQNTVIVHAMLISDQSRQKILITRANHPEHDDSLRLVQDAQVSINGIPFRRFDDTDLSVSYNYYSDSLEILPGHKYELLIIIDHDTIHGTTDTPAASELSADADQVCWTASSGGYWYAVTCTWDGEGYFNFGSELSHAGCKQVPRDDPDLQWGWFDAVIGAFDKNYYLYTRTDGNKAGLTGNALGLFGSVTVSKQKVYLPKPSY
jgi:hypothetical protein